MSSRAIPKTDSDARTPLTELHADLPAALPGAIEPSTPVAELVRELCKIAPGRAETSDGNDAVVLDMEVDGFRCLLVKLERGESQALSPREREIARLVARGYPNKVIAGILEISTWTVGTHLRRIFAKLNINSRAAMVARLQNDNLL